MEVKCPKCETYFNIEVRLNIDIEYEAMSYSLIEDTEREPCKEQ